MHNSHQRAILLESGACSGMCKRIRITITFSTCRVKARLVCARLKDSSHKFYTWTIEMFFLSQPIFWLELVVWHTTFVMFHKFQCIIGVSVEV